MDSQSILRALDPLIDFALLAALATGVFARKVPSRWRLTLTSMALVMLFNLAESLLAGRAEPGTLFNADRIVHVGEVFALVGTVVAFRWEERRPNRLLEKAERHSSARGGMDMVPAIVVSSTPDGIIRDVNRYGIEVLGAGIKDLVGQSVFRLASRGANRKSIESDFMRFVASAGQLGSEAEYQIAVGGHTRLIRWRRTAQIDARGIVVGVVSYGEDVTAHRDAEDRLADESYLLDSVHDAVVVTGNDGERLYFNRAALNLTGMDRDEFAKLPPSGWILPQCQPEVERHLLEAREPGNHTIEVFARRRDGSEVPIELRSQRIQFSRRDCVMTVVRDISSRRQAQRLVEQLAYTDPLTGLANRRMVLDFLAAEASGDARRGGALAVLYVDVDNLKGVNDSLGHQAGDTLIRFVGERLAEVTREDDLVGRVGGDEFIIVLKDIDNIGRAEDVAARMLERLKEPLMLLAHQLEVSASIGIMRATGVDSPEELLAKADRAMYYAKRSGGHCYLMHDESMDETYIERFTLKNDLTHALERQEFFLEFQPIVNSSEERVVGAEALIRWAHPTRGVLYPDAFIELTEETGAIREIGNWVLQEGCRYLSEFRRQGLALQRVAVNVSPVQLREPSFVIEVMATLESYGLTPSDLHLEITERQAMDHLGEVESNLRELATVGVGIALDDFGVGHSSLERLQYLPITHLKLDRRFVADLCHSSSAHPIIQTILVLAYHLKLGVVAEGVETACQAEHLRDVGCGELQGFAYCRPCSPSALLDWSLLRIEASECDHPCLKRKHPEPAPDRVIQVVSGGERLRQARRHADSCQS